MTFLNVHQRAGFWVYFPSTHTRPTSASVSCLVCKTFSELFEYRGAYCSLCGERMMPLVAIVCNSSIVHFSSFSSSFTPSISPLSSGLRQRCVALYSQREYVWLPSPALSQGLRKDSAALPFFPVWILLSVFDKSYPGCRSRFGEREACDGKGGSTH